MTTLHQLINNLKINLISKNLSFYNKNSALNQIFLKKLITLRLIKSFQEINFKLLKINFLKNKKSWKIIIFKKKYKIFKKRINLKNIYICSTAYGLITSTTVSGLLVCKIIV